MVYCLSKFVLRSAEVAVVEDVGNSYPLNTRIIGNAAKLVAAAFWCVKPCRWLNGSSGSRSHPRHVLETHVSTEEVGKMAAEARVKTVVLNHLLPGGNGARGPVPTTDVYTADVKKFFDGEVIVGADQMRI